MMFGSKFWIMIRSFFSLHSGLSITLKEVYLRKYLPIWPQILTADEWITSCAMPSIFMFLKSFLNSGQFIPAQWSLLVVFWGFFSLLLFLPFQSLDVCATGSFVIQDIPNILCTAHRYWLWFNFPLSQFQNAFLLETALFMLAQTKR